MSGVAIGAHRRHRLRLRYLVVAGVAAAVVAGAGVVALVAPWSGAATPVLRAVGPSSSPSATPSPGEGPSRESRLDPRAGQPGGGGIPGEFPDESTTGVTGGVELRPSGTVVVQDDGAVVENLSITDGIVEVRANDVTIRNVRITNDQEFIQWGITQETGFRGLVVEDSEIFGNGVQQFASGISNSGGTITVRRVEIHTITDGIMTSHGLIEDNYLHSPKLFAEDHTDMIQTVGGSTEGLPLVISHNTVINTEPQTSAVLLDDANGIGLVPVRDVLLEGNLLAGGGYTLYCGGFEEEGHEPSDIVIRSNVFSRQLWEGSGYYGPVAYFDSDAPGNLWTDNVFDDGSPVEPDG
jgi:hypothetical protein